MTGTASPLTAVYRGALAGIAAGVLMRLLVAWATLWDPERPLWSAARLGELVATWTGGAQLAAAELATRWLAARTADAWSVPPGTITPYAIPAGLVGSSAAGSGSPLAALTGLAPAVFWSRLMGGDDRQLATAATAAWLGRLGVSEPYRAANLTVAHNVRTDRRLTGRSRRVIRSTACSFCTELAARGWTRAAGFPAHGHCGCTAEPEIGMIR